MKLLHVRGFAVFAVLATAMVIALGLYIDPYSSWRQFWSGFAMVVAGTLIDLALVWAILLGRWSSRLFALGFVLGAALENRALAYYARHDLLRLTPGTWLPEGWYPLTIPIERILMERGWGSVATPPLIFLAMGLSGIACGVVLLAIRGTWWRVSRCRKDPGGGQPVPRGG